jgi:hypothetical protein
MPYILTSKASSRPLLVFLANGSSVRLSPRQESGVIADVDVEDVPAIERLEREGLLDVRRVDDGDVTVEAVPDEGVPVEGGDDGQAAAAGEPAAAPEAPPAAPARARGRAGRTRQSSEPRASAEGAPAESTAP